MVSPSPYGLQSVPTPHAAESDLIEFESLNNHLEPLVQSSLIRNKNMGIRHEEYDIAGPSRARQPIKRSDQPNNSEVTSLLDSPFEYGLVGSPILDPTLRDPNLEVGITTKGKENERGYSNERDYNNVGYPTSTSFANSRDMDPILPRAN